MVNEIVPTERQEHGECGTYHAGGQTPKPRGKSQAAAKLWMHDGSVVEWPADGSIAIVGHDCQEDTFSCPQPVGDIELDHTPSIAYGFVWSPEIDQELRDDAEANAQEGKVDQKEVHRVWRCTSTQETTMMMPLPKDRHHINPQDKDKKDGF